MIKVIIFSKDRPAQLDLTLTSIARNFQLDASVYVLYKASNTKFEEGYDILREYREPTDCYCMGEYDFRDDLLRLMAGPEKYTMFLTDDDIFYRKADYTEKDLDDLFSINGFYCFSNRLGINTTVQNPHNRSELAQLPKFDLIKDGDKEFLLWNWKTVGGNFGYPLSVDGHIFRTEDIISLTEKTEFKNPNFYEAHLQAHLCRIGPGMASCKNSVLFGNPVNRVQDTFTNNAGQFYGISAEDLNREFLRGKRLQFGGYGEICGAHQEVPLSWG
jgi:hypothetical protein